MFQLEYQSDTRLQEKIFLGSLFDVLNNIRLSILADNLEIRNRIKENEINSNNLLTSLNPQSKSVFQLLFNAVVYEG